MSLALWVGRKHFQVGDAGFLKAVFSTVFIRLERENWGARYPVIMRDLYAGVVSSSRAGDALKEVAALRQDLQNHTPSEVVWDFERRETQPPWASAISPHISSLANYFVTSDGKDFFDVLSNALREAAQSGSDLTIG